MPHVSGKQLYPHQREALNRLDNGKVLWGGVGTGKSLTAVAYYVEKEAPRDVIVITTAKKRDSLEWEGEFVKYGIGSEYSTAGTLTVDSWNNIAKYQKRHGAFFIFDEQRLVGSGAWVKAFIKISRRNRWILLSATPGDTWLDYVPLFIANGYFANQTEFKREHVVYKAYSKFPKVDRYIGVGRLLRLRHNLLVEMPYLSTTVRHVKDVEIEYDLDDYNKVVKRKWNIFLNQPLRNVTDLFIAMRRVVNSHPSRLNAVTKLLRAHPRLIVFYNFDYELETLRSLATATSGTGSGTSTSNFVVAEWNGHRHDPVPTTDNWVYLVQYTAGAEGWNCITTNAMCFYSLPYSYKIWHQAFGRIDRLNTEYVDLYYYVLFSKSDIDRAIRRALEEKQNFNESVYYKGAK